MQPVISIRDLTKTYAGGFEALKSVSLDIKPGEIFGLLGPNGAGKTTLVERLVAEIVGRGYTVSTLKHTHHGVDVDRPGKDSHRHREAGARQVILSSSARWAIMTELRGANNLSTKPQWVPLSWL